MEAPHLDTTQQKQSGWENVKAQDKQDDLFADVSADSPVTEIQSLCMQCEEQGTTRLLLTKIPFFKDIILMSFSCPHCNWRNTEVQSASSVEEKGCRYELTVRNPKMLNRQIVKSHTATILVPALELEIPAITQRGSLNNVEGFLVQTADSLEYSNDERKKADPAAAAKVAAFVAQLREYAEGKHLPFVLIVDDPAGNSVIQNPFAPKEDPDLKVVHYTRTPEQNAALGVTDTPAPYLDDGDNPVTAPDEVYMIPTMCSMCHAPGYMKSVLEDIPHFREVLLMAFACSKCGYKTNENREDLSRDVLKSETASVEVPEVELELGHGTLGGKFTTVEGLLLDVKNQLKDLPFFRAADSVRAGPEGRKTADPEALAQQERMAKLIADLDKLMEGKTPFTLVIDDPLGGSYIQNPNAPDPDPQLRHEEYERPWEVDEEFGINALKEEEKKARMDAATSSAPPPAPPSGSPT